jgi:hypothetical protein
MLTVRYGIGAVMIVGGIVTLVVSPAGLGVDGFAMAAGGGISVILINLMYRLSVSGEEDREREERARAYLGEHGEWPPEEPSAEPGREREPVLVPIAAPRRAHAASVRP